MLWQLNSLSREEFKKFGEFINSPYFNKFRTIKRLYSYLRNIHPDITSNHVTMKKISEAVYEESGLNKVKIRKLISDFKSLFEKFILCEEFSRENTENKITMLVALRKRFLFDIYGKKLKEIKQLGRKAFGTDEKYYFNLMNYYNELFQYSFSSETGNPRKFSIKKTEYLNCFFIYQSLVFNYNKHSDKTTSVSEYNPLFPDFTKHVFSFIESNIDFFSGKYPDIMTLYYANMMLTTGDDLYYKKLLRYFRTNRNKFDYNLQTMFYLVSENFLKIKLSNNRNEANRRSLFEMRKIYFSKKHFENFYEEGRMIPASEFFNIVNEAVLLKEFEWAKVFIQTGSKFIPKIERHEVLKITGIILKFFEREHDELLLLINGIKKTNTRYFIYSRMIKLMLYYEYGNLEALKYDIDSFKKYLIRLSISDKSDAYILRKGDSFHKSMKYLLQLKIKCSETNSNSYLDYKVRYNKEKDFKEYSFWFEEKIKELDKINRKIV